VSSNRSQRPARTLRLLPLSRSHAPSDSTVIESEIAALEQQLKDVESELAKLKAARDKAKR
jgi:hypothetical protein